MTATRTISVTVKMSESDWDQVARAAEILWPRAPLTKNFLLTLAKSKAESVLEQQPTKKSRS